MRVQGAIILTVAILVAEAWGFRGDSRRWHVNDIPVKYYFESSVPEWAEKPIREAFDHWTAVEDSYISFEETSSSTSARIFVSFGYIDGPEGKAGFCLRVTRRGRLRLLSAGIVFDSGEGWENMADPALAIESVALHEIGHAVSLLDLYDADDKPYVMYHRPGYKHDDLTQDDKNGAIWAYPRDLQDAIDLAYGEEDQDTVMVPKAYSQDVYMKGGLTLRGDVDGELGEGINGIVYVMNISNVTLMDLDISASGYCPGVYISNSSPAIDDNNIEGYAAIYCNNYSFPDILQTKLHSGEYGIYVDIYSLPEVRYNDITNNNKGVYLDDYTDAFLGDEVNGGNNNIINYSYNVYASYDAALEILAQYNWWGTTDRDAILSKLHHENPDGQIVFEPYRESPAKPAIWDIARRFYRMATEAYHQGRYHDAIVYSRQVVEDYPDTKFSPHALVVLFWSYRKLGKLEEVYPYLEDVAQRNFGLEVCRVAMELGMKELLDRGEFLGVVERAREIMDVFPDRERNENLKFLIAEAYELSGDVARARDAYRDFLEEYP